MSSSPSELLVSTFKLRSLNVFTTSCLTICAVDEFETDVAEGVAVAVAAPTDVDDDPLPPTD